MKLSEQILQALSGSKKALLIGSIADKVTLTKHQCRIRKVLGELERSGAVHLTDYGWRIVRKKASLPKAA